MSDVRIGAYSQKASPSKARVGASVRVRATRPARPPVPAATRGDKAAPSAAYVPSLPEGSARLHDRTPSGPGTFWYPAVGLQCIYVPDSSPACYRVGPGGGAQRVDPREMAAGAARRLTLSAGRIVTSPTAQASGLTGATSWLWLDGMSGASSVTASAGGERVTVSAMPSDIAWSFGDGRIVHAGRGVPYGSGDGRDAVRHRYRTRCLPGDRGRNPYVLDGCAEDGYQVRAVVTWAIAYRAAGPVTESGSLPSRTTEAAIAYPVSEARGFLTGGDRS